LSHFDQRAGFAAMWEISSSMSEASATDAFAYL